MAHAICAGLILAGIFLPWGMRGQGDVRTGFSIIRIILEAREPLAITLLVLTALCLGGLVARGLLRIFALLTGILATYMAIAYAITQTGNPNITPGFGLFLVGLGGVGLLGTVFAPGGHAEVDFLTRRFLAKPADVVNHWFSLVEDFNASTSDFYQQIEAELAARKLPGATAARVEFHEGGLLSARREYLRVRRERLVFDICAAPLGTSYFFSLRVCLVPLRLNLIALFLLLALLVHFTFFFGQNFGLGRGILAAALTIFLLAFIFRQAIRPGFHNLDDTLMKLPILGSIYEVFFRRETYFRHDLRLMYLRQMDLIVKRQVTDLTAAKGVKLAKQFEFSPLFGRLYEERPKEISLDLASPIQVTNDAGGA